jgi:hypothetical protein
VIAPPRALIRSPAFIELPEPAQAPKPTSNRGSAESVMNLFMKYSSFANQAPA